MIKFWVCIFEKYTESLLFSYICICESFSIAYSLWISEKFVTVNMVNEPFMNHIIADTEFLLCIIHVLSKLEIFSVACFLFFFFLVYLLIFLVNVKSIVKINIIVSFSVHVCTANSNCYQIGTMKKVQHSGMQ